MVDMWSDRQDISSVIVTEDTDYVLVSVLTILLIQNACSRMSALGR